MSISLLSGNFMIHFGKFFFFFFVAIGYSNFLHYYSSLKPAGYFAHTRWNCIEPETSPVIRIRKYKIWKYFAAAKLFSGTWRPPDKL